MHKENLFCEWTITITTKTNDRINVLNENLRQFKNHKTLSFPLVGTILDQNHENFVVVSIDKVTNNVALICKYFYASVTIKVLGFNNNDKTSIFKRVW